MGFSQPVWALAKGVAEWGIASPCLAVEGFAQSAAPHPGFSMTSTKQQELQDWRATLTKEEDETLQQMIQDQGEEYVLSILGFLKQEFELARTL